MINQYRYANTDPIYFKLTKNGEAVGDKTGYAFSALDVQTKIGDGTITNWVDISTAITYEGLGWYQWTPTAAAQTTGKVILINIKDAVGTDFDENGLSIITGGDPAAMLNGV